MLEEVAIQFAHRFAPGDRNYTGTSDKPSWRHEVIDALAAVQATGLGRRTMG